MELNIKTYNMVMKETELGHELNQIIQNLVRVNRLIKGIENEIKNNKTNT